MLLFEGFRGLFSAVCIAVLCRGPFLHELIEGKYQFKPPFEKQPRPESVVFQFAVKQRRALDSELQAIEWGHKAKTDQKELKCAHW